MSCPHCHAESPPGMKFCGQCGGKLAESCSQCGAELPAGFKFCGACGASLSAAPPPEPVAPAPRPPGPEAHASALTPYTPSHLSTPAFQSKSALEGERKRVTVLFCDLVGSTALADRLGPETMHLLLNRFFELALSEIHRYEGTINQFLGDGFMALFGAPIAHEDHARRAALAALGLQRLLAELDLDPGALGPLELRFRMGVHTGWVVVGGIGDQLRRDYTAIGDTTNLAARLQQLAEPGAILVSEETSRLLNGSARLETLPPLQVKGKEAPVQAFRLLGVGLLPSEDAVLGGAARSPFVGRRREMSTLEELRDRARQGEGQVVGIAAEAGSGKSRLIYEFRRRSSDGPVLHLAGRCLSYAAGIPYLPILYLLRHAWEMSEGDGEETTVAKVAAGLRRADLELEEALPYFLHLLGLPGTGERLAALSPQAVQARTFRLLRQVILNAAQSRLVVLEIEDLHWVDRTSEEFLRFLVDGLFAAPVLLITTYRSGYRPPWMEKSYATQIALSRLSEKEGEAVVRSVLRRVELPERLVGEILGRAEGNPFFLEELARSLVEHPGVGVPDTVQGVLAARIDRLPEEHKRLLQTASVLGREFSQRLLALMWDEEPELAPLVADLKRWEFLYEEPTAEEPHYLFKHALTQEAVYQTLLKGRRQALHGAAGRAFETIFAGRPADAYDRLAYHFSAAGETETALFYVLQFARQAAGRYAHAEAERALREALVHAAQLPATEAARRRLEILLLLAESLLPLARFAETLELFEAERPAVERLAEGAAHGRYHFWLAHTYSYLGDQAAASEHAHLAIEVGRRLGDAQTEGLALYVLSRDAFWSGRYTAGIEAGRRALALLESGADAWWQGQAYWVCGFHHYLLGELDEAFDCMRRADAIWRRLQDPRLDPSWSTGYFHASLGQWDLGIEECRGGVERAQDPLNRAAALGFLGYAYLQKGDLESALPALEESVGRLREAGLQPLWGWFSAILGEALLAIGRSPEAGLAAGEALRVTEAVGFPFGAAIARRLQGRLELAAGDRPGAERWLGLALASFESLGAPFEIARTHLDLATAAGAGSGAAASHLGAARRLFTALRLPLYVERTETLARELSAEPAGEGAKAPSVK